MGGGEFGEYMLHAIMVTLCWSTNMFTSIFLKFMWHYCVCPKRSFCKGHTLHHHIHVLSEPFQREKNMNIAKQVVQAMGYLHASGIIHKNLNTRNIFLEYKDKVVITDASLSNLRENIYVR